MRRRRYSIGHTSYIVSLPISAGPTGAFLVARRHGAIRYRVALSRPAVVVVRDDLEVQVLCRPGKGKHWPNGKGVHRGVETWRRRSAGDHEPKTRATGGSGNPKAKHWPGEQKSCTRRSPRVRKLISSKPGTCREAADVNAAGISESHVYYPVRSAVLPLCYRHLEVPGLGGRSQQKP